MSLCVWVLIYQLCEPSHRTRYGTSATLYTHTHTCTLSYLLEVRVSSCSAGSRQHSPRMGRLDSGNVVIAAARLCTDYMQTEPAICCRVACEHSAYVTPETVCIVQYSIDNYIKFWAPSLGRTRTRARKCALCPKRATTYVPFLIRAKISVGREHVVLHYSFDWMEWANQRNAPRNTICRHTNIREWIVGKYMRPYHWVCGASEVFAGVRCRLRFRFAHMSAGWTPKRRMRNDEFMSMQRGPPADYECGFCFLYDITMMDNIIGCRYWRIQQMFTFRYILNKCGH